MPRFSIEVSDKLVAVKSIENKPRFTATLVLTILFCWGLGIYVLASAPTMLRFLFRGASTSDVWGWILAVATLFLGSSFLWAGFRVIFPSGESFVCDANALTVTRIPSYSLTGLRKSQTFPIQSIKQMQFSSVSTDGMTSIPGLIFHVHRAKRKALFGLEAPEAEQVLQALSRLGVETVHDPAMPMMIEMAMSRRKSRFGLS